MSNANRDVIVVMTTLPDRETAKRLALLLIENGHAACVNILADCTSVYRWQGSIETASEVPLVIKTTASAYQGVEREIRSSHPYAIPEIVSVPVVSGLPAYLDWVAQQCVCA